jgi:hypothetical protein
MEADKNHGRRFEVCCSAYTALAHGFMYHRYTGDVFTARF